MVAQIRVVPMKETPDAQRRYPGSDDLVDADICSGG
jgi:hypothetical protein